VLVDRLSMAARRVERSMVSTGRSFEGVDCQNWIVPSR
jgi:hypothetical protein